MTTVTRSLTLTDVRNGEALIASWTALDGDDDGTALDVPAGYDVRSIQVTGTFDSGSVALHGSNDGSNYAALAAIAAGSAIAITAAGIKNVADATRYVKPVVSSGGASCSLTVTLFLKRK